MASKKAKLEEGRQKVRMKLQEIDEQYIEILSELQELVTKSREAAIALLQEPSKVNFFKKFVRVNQSLEECSSKLFTIRLSISSETDSESDGQNEDSATSLESCNVGQLSAIKNSDINRSSLRAQQVTKMNQSSPEVANLRTSIESERMWISSQCHSIQSVVNETVTTESQGKIVIGVKCTEQYHRGIQPQALKTPLPNQNIIVSGIEEIFDDSPTSDTSNLRYEIPAYVSVPDQNKSLTEEDISQMSLTITDISDIESTKQNYPKIVAHSSIYSPLDKNDTLNELSPNVNIIEENLIVEENHPNVFFKPVTLAAVVSSSNQSKILEGENISTASSITNSASDAKFAEENYIINRPSSPKSSLLFNGCILNENSSEVWKIPVKNTKPNKDVVSNQTMKTVPLLPKVIPLVYESSGNEASSEVVKPSIKNTKTNVDSISIQPMKTSNPTSPENKPNQDDVSNQSVKISYPSSPKGASIDSENLSEVICNIFVKNNRLNQDDVLNKSIKSFQVLPQKKTHSANGCNENEKTSKLCEMSAKNTNHISLTQSMKIFPPSPIEIPINAFIENDRLSPVCEIPFNKNKSNQCDASTQSIKISSVSPPKKIPTCKTLNEKGTSSEEFKIEIKSTELSSDVSSQSFKISPSLSNKKVNSVNEVKPTCIPIKETIPDLPQKQLHSLAKPNKKATANNSEMNLMEKITVQEYMVVFPEVSEKMLDMIATEFLDPSDFWVHLPNAHLEPLVNSMRIYYTQGEENVVIAKPCVGLICSALFTLDNCWYRAQILEIHQAPSKGNLSDCQVKVLYIDYGNSEVLPVSKLMVLKKEFMSLPRHAIHCSLARICPISKSKWSSEDSKFLSEIINNQPLQGTCKRIKNSDNFEIELYQIDTDGTSKNISDFLVEQNHAQYVKETSILLSNKPNQFPDSDSDGRNSECQRNTVSPGCYIPPPKLPASPKGPSKGSNKNIDNPLSFAATKSDKINSSRKVDSLLEPLSSPQKCTCNADTSSHIFHCRVHDWPDNPEANPNLDKNFTSNKITNIINMKENSEDCLNSFPTLSNLPKSRIIDYFTFTMAYIFSPGKFYIHLIDSKSDSIKNLLNDFYDKHELDPQYIFNHVPPIGTICCVKFSVDKFWYRASIIELEPGLKEKIRIDKKLAQMKVKVCFIDYGNSESKLLSEIRSLDPIFFKFPIQAICCSLATIEPVSDESSPKSEWTKASIEQFISLTDFETGFIGIVHKEEPCQSEQSSTNLKLFVIDTRQPKKIIINDTLVRLGLARMNLSKSIKISPEGIWCRPDDASSCEKYLTPIFSEVISALDANTNEPEENSISDWDPMAEDFESIENTYTAAPNDFNCVKNEKVSLPEVKTNSPQVGSWVAVQVTAVKETLKFSVIFPYGVECLKMKRSSGDKKVDSSDKENLSDLIDAMTSHYSKIKQMDKDPFLPSLGEIVAARYSGYDHWYRAKITQVDYNTEDIKVIYLDYGHTEWINHNFIRRILPQFLQLPFQGVSCNLNDVEIEDCFKNQARQFFELLVEGKTLVAHVLLKDVEDTIHVDLYDTSNGNDININRKLKEAGYAHSKPTVYVEKDESSLIPG